MDVMRPELKWVNGCCFRINIVDLSIPQEEKTVDFPKSFQEYEDEPDSCLNANADDVKIVCDDSGKYSTFLHVASAYFPIIIGSRGATRKRLENETRTQIQIPKMGHEGDIKIKGLDHKGVSTACRRIGLIVMSSRQRQPFTHFISVSMAGDEIRKSFIQFKKDVMESCGSSRGVSETIFQHEQKLHLTFGTLVLLDKVEREQAAKALLDALLEVVKPLLEGQVLKVRMKGLEYMNDDPSEVDVLYGKVNVIEGRDGGDILQQLADEMVNFFNQRGLIQKEHDRVKLHVTLMNTRFRKEDLTDRVPPSKGDEWKGNEGNHDLGGQLKRVRESFDASSILEKFGDYDFGEHVIEEIQLSQRFSTGKNGYYQSTAKITIL